MKKTKRDPFMKHRVVSLYPTRPRSSGGLINVRYIHDKNLTKLTLACCDAIRFCPVSQNIQCREHIRLA